MSKSPDQKHKAQLNLEGEIRFGPPFFKLVIDGIELSGRIFGAPLCWSDDSRYLAAQEWLTTDYQKGPITRVLLIDLEQGRVSEFKIVEKGFVEDFRFHGGTFMYLKNFQGTGRGIETEVDISDIHNWRCAHNKKIQRME